VTVLLLLGAAGARAQVLTEGFDNITTLPGAGWFIQNNSQPIGVISWFQGNDTVFPAHQGAPTAYIGVNFNSGGGLATISNWLLTPEIPLANGATMTFWTRSVNGDFPDRLQVRMSTAGNGTDVGTTATSVGTFTTLLLDINPNYTPTGYPVVWTEFPITLTGIPTPTTGRLAFRYFVENAGPSGANSNYIGVDTFTFTPVLVQATALQVDPAPGNLVLEPNEPGVVVAPTWTNSSPATIASLTGTASNFTGPTGPTYTLTDSSANYGSVAAGASASCLSTGNCYGVTVTAATRPAQHWDAALDETVSAGGSNTWTLHVGGTFTDVLTTSAFYRFVETLIHNGVTGGCGTDTYCPTSTTTREQMAVFVLVAKEGAGYSPSACTPPNLFSDVPETSPFCRFIEELANRNVVTGCGTNLYCPSNAVLRDQMAIFVLRTLDPALNPPACVAGSEMFTDVPSTSPFCRWIEELARRGVVSGCGTNLYCPADPVTREQMGVFLSATFGLTLYGV
jgi:hypothetical protein